MRVGVGRGKKCLGLGVGRSLGWVEFCRSLFFSFRFGVVIECGLNKVFLLIL